MKDLKPIIEKMITKLSAENQTVSFAESCTGGRIAAAITSVSGSSAILRGSTITYANEIKTAWLGVPESTLETKGAVSQECVQAMLTGMQKMVSSDYTLAVSGIAGPTGGSECKPVGTVYIGIMTPDGVQEVKHCLFKGNREEVQNQATAFSIGLLQKKLKI